MVFVGLDWVLAEKQASFAKSLSIIWPQPLNGRAQILEEDLIDLGDGDLGLSSSLGNGGI